MEQIAQLFTEWGYAGIFLSAFLAGSIVPFASEAVVVLLAQSGLSPWLCLLWATAGNTLGGVSCYWIGRLGKTEWINRWLKIKPAALERAQRFLKGRGAVMALFVALPYIGDAIAVALGLMRADFALTTVAMAIGKGLRYIAVLYAAEGIISLF
ncbi:MAG: DedA family protein [Alistipes sp.]|nr:DedA family protein [Alistipes sp.]